MPIAITKIHNQNQTRKQNYFLHAPQHKPSITSIMPCEINLDDTYTNYTTRVTESRSTNTNSNKHLHSR